MGFYVYGCPCGYEQEEIHSMRDNPEILCPMCGKRCERIPQLTSQIIPRDFNWHSKNGGKGQWISGLGKESDPKAYCTSVAQAEEKAKARGMTYEKG